MTAVPSNPTVSDLPPVPLRMLNEVAYCPRLFALEWLNGEWVDSADTVSGRRAHKRVDRPSAEPLKDDEKAPRVVRSVALGDDELGLTGRIDLVEVEGSQAVPVDYKRGRPPDVPGGAWEPERVQLCGQGLLLRAHGYEVDHGVIYFVGGRRRVEIPFDDELVERTLYWRDRAREIARGEGLPDPLVDDPRCPRCSLVGICLPDEQNLLNQKCGEVRPLVPARPDGVPLYVQHQGGSIGKDHDEIVVRHRRTEVGRARIENTTRLVVLGNLSVSTPLLRELASRDIPVSFHSYGGWYWGQFQSPSGHNVMTRIAQHRVAQDPAASLPLARAFVHSKIVNCRVILRRNGEGVPSKVLLRLDELARDAEHAPSVESLLGTEGAAAMIYFQQFHTMLRRDLEPVFRFEGRNRRPPRDPINAMLSFAYAVLARELTAILHGIGFDPYVGYLHRPRFGRPALALDLMEEFRPLVADSAVISAVNRKRVKPGDFDVGHTGVQMRRDGRKRFIQVLERRLDELATHPVLGIRLSYRRILEVQARFLGKVLLGDLETWPEYHAR